MKINAINNYKYPNLSFGQISSKAIDLIRKHSEGYNIEVTPEGTEESYNLSPDFCFLSPEQLKKLKTLTSRANKLNRSLITQSAITEGFDVSFRTTSPQVKTFEFDLNSTGNAEYLLDVLQSAVKTAEQIEKNTANRILFTEDGYTRKGIAKSNSRQITDRFRSIFDKKILQSIYDDTITIQHEKMAVKTNKKRNKYENQ